MKTSTARSRLPGYSTTVEVVADADVEISADDLRAEGWHHDSECASTGHTAGGSGYLDAVRSLHRQAHPSQPADPVTCTEEPCRSLSYEQLTTRLGRP
jgi:hypothetical protein